MSRAPPPTAAAAAAAPSADDAVRAVRRWVDGAVIGLNLCPFAKVVVRKGQLRWTASDAADPVAVLQRLRGEAERLAAADAGAVDTVLLVCPRLFADDFGSFDGVVQLAEQLLADDGHDGVLQLAAFHPRWRFAGTRTADLGNLAQQAPHPTLHLLREASVTRAVDSHPDPDAIGAANAALARRLGRAGWARAVAAAAAAAPSTPGVAA